MVKKILITGARGFIGSNLVAHLTVNPAYEILVFDADDTDEDLRKYAEKADFVFHLAGINRPENDEAFITGNAVLTSDLLDLLEKRDSKPPILIASSVQSELDNPYGRSKKAAEEAAKAYSQRGGTAYIYRLTNVFGKWCRPNYNSVIATFCHNIAREKEITISDRQHEVEFIYIDDVISEFISVLEKGKKNPENYYSIEPSYRVTLGDLADTLHRFHGISQSLCIPDFSKSFVRKLYATYVSYLPEDRFSHRLKVHEDPRGSLFEFIKSEQFGQIFISTSKPGVRRGDHYHHTKIEKFCVIRGEAVIEFRHIITHNEVLYEVSGDRPEIVNIPPGYVHAITNTGACELVTLFWADEMFNPEKSDTFVSDLEL